MWQLDYIHLKRFQSHIDSRYEFKNNETTMVYGVNMDDLDGADSNGAGKSVIVRAITVALLKIPHRDLTKDDYVMDGEKFAEVELHLTNKAFNKTMLIEREIHRKDSSIVRITENGVLNSQLTGPDESDAHILKMLDLTKDDILNYFIINQDNSHSFFKAGDTAKKEIIARFTNTSLLDIVLDEVNADLTIVNAEIKKSEDSILKVEARLSTLNEQMDYEQTERQKDNEERVEQLRDELEDLEEAKRLNLDGKAKIKNKLQQVSVEVKKFSKIKDEKVLEIQKENTKLALPLKKDERKETEKLIGELEIILNGKVTCPACSHEFSVVDDEMDLSELESSKAECEEMVKDLTEDINQINQKLDEIDDSIEEIKDQKRKFRRIQSDIEDLEDDLKNRDKKDNNIDKEIALINKKIGTLKEFKTDTKRIVELKKEIEMLGLEQQSSLKKIDEKTAERDDITFWQINFSEMGLKTFLINKVLENLEGHINNTLSRFKVNLVVKINGYTVLKSKKVKETIDVLVSKDGGKTWKVFKRFSGGQKERINVSGILTLRNLINESSKYGGLNFLALDEFFEGLDVKGQKMVLPILEASGITCLVISHMNNNIGARNELYIEYEDNISTIRK